MRCSPSSSSSASRSRCVKRWTPGVPVGVTSIRRSMSPPRRSGSAREPKSTIRRHVIPVSAHACATARRMPSRSAGVRRTWGMVTAIMEPREMPTVPIVPREHQRLCHPRPAARDPGTFIECTIGRTERRAVELVGPRQRGAGRRGSRAHGGRGSPHRHRHPHRQDPDRSRDCSRGHARLVAAAETRSGLFIVIGRATPRGARARSWPTNAQTAGDGVFQQKNRSSTA